MSCGRFPAVRGAARGDVVLRALFALRLASGPMDDCGRRFAQGSRRPRDAPGAHRSTPLFSRHQFRKSRFNPFALAGACSASGGPDQVARCGWCHMGSCLEGDEPSEAGRSLDPAGRRDARKGPAAGNPKGRNRPTASPARSGVSLPDRVRLRAR